MLLFAILYIIMLKSDSHAYTYLNSSLFRSSIKNTKYLWASCGAKACIMC